MSGAISRNLRNVTIICFTPDNFVLFIVFALICPVICVFFDSDFLYRANYTAQNLTYVFHFICALNDATCTCNHCNNCKEQDASEQAPDTRFGSIFSKKQYTDNDDQQDNNHLFYLPFY